MTHFQSDERMDRLFPDFLRVKEIVSSLHKSLYAYRGTSMFPTLHEPDALEIVPYGKNIPHVGDVVVCMPPDYTDYIVHRISCISPDGFITRGDNTRMDDQWVLMLNDIAGRVVFVWQGNKQRKLPDWFISIVQFRVNWLWNKVVRSLFLFVRPLYQQVSDSGIVYRILPQQFRPKLLRFTQQGEIVLRLIWLDTVIGNLHSESGTWLIKPLYRLLVDPKLLLQTRTK